jgi:hypothetical protein
MTIIESPVGVARIRVGDRWISLNTAEESGSSVFRVATVADMLALTEVPKLNDLSVVVNDLHLYQFFGPDHTQITSWQLLSSAYFQLHEVSTKADLSTLTSATLGDLAFVSDTHALYCFTGDPAPDDWLCVASRPATWENLILPDDLIALPAHQGDLAIVQYSDPASPDPYPGTYVLSNDEPTLLTNWVKLPTEGGVAWKHVVTNIEPGTGGTTDLEEGAIWLNPNETPLPTIINAMSQEVHVASTDPGRTGRPIIWADTSNVSSVPIPAPYLPTSGGEMTGTLQMASNTQITMATGAKINYGANVNDHIYLYDSGTAGAKYGIGIQSGLMAFFVSADSGSFRWRLGSSTGTDWMALDTDRLTIHGSEAVTTASGDIRYHKKGSPSPMNYGEWTVTPYDATIFDGQNKILYNDFIVTWYVSVTANSLAENAWRTCVANTAYATSLRPRFGMQYISNMVNEAGDAGCIGVRVRILTDGTVQYFKPGNGPNYETNSPFSISFVYPRW